MGNECVVCIVDDDEHICSILELLLESVGKKVKTFISPIDFLEYCNFNNIGCAVIDIRMPEISGLQLLKKLTEKDHNFPVIMISGHADVSCATQAFKNGAVDFFEKPFSNQLILDSIDTAMKLQHKHNMQTKEIIDINNRINSLTKREHQIMELIIESKSNRMIAQILNISSKTVDFHRTNILEKLGVNSSIQLTKVIIKAKYLCKYSHHELRKCSAFYK